MDERPRLIDRLGIAAVVMLIAAFALGTMSTLTAGADDQASGVRHDGPDGLVATDDDDDDDDDTTVGTTTRTGTTRFTGASNTRTNDTATGTFTRTGTTRGTGPSNTRTRDTRTGTFTPPN